MRKISLILIITGFAILAGAQPSQRTIFDDTGFVIEPMDSLNTVGSDMCPAFVEGKLYYSSIREAYFNKKNREHRNMAFYDLYSATLSQSGKTVSHRELVSGFGQKYHEGPAVWCERTGELFNTMSNVIEMDTIRKMFSYADIRLRLVIQKKVDNKWQIAEEFPYNNKDYNLAHPAISQSGDTLVFSSNRDSTGFGKIDLYMSIRKDGKWSVPVNLGDKINTPGNDMFPTFLPGGLLAFSSDGRIGGEGALDIWYTTFPVTGEVKNAGNKINSRFDDFGLTLHPGGKVGYFTSNRQGSDDIFRVDITRFYEIFRGRVVDDVKNIPIENATVQLTDCEGKVRGSTLTKLDGYFDIEVTRGQCPVVKAGKEGYSEDRKDISGLRYVELRLKQDQPYEIIVVDIDSRRPLAGAKITCEDKTWQTDRVGVCKFIPAQVLGCNLRIGGGGYLDQTFVPQKGSLRDTVFMYKKEINKVFTLKNIFYDYDKWDILPESETELNNLIKIMKDNPEIKVELGSHTDAKKSDSYNRLLSQKRSDSAVSYIIRNGISKDKIIAKGYGESQLVNKCKNGVKCSDEEHRQNRRTEFKIIGI